MRYITPLLLAATLAVAAPTNFTIPEQHLFPRSFQGSIQFFSRYDCTNPCVNIGYCTAGKMLEGDLPSEDSFVGWDSGCWDRPAGTHSVAVAVNNGHKFLAIDKTCEEFHNNGYQADTFQIPTANAEEVEEGKCLEMANHKWKAVFYEW